MWGLMCSELLQGLLSGPLSVLGGVQLGGGTMQQMPKRSASGRMAAMYAKGSWNSASLGR